MNDFDPSQPASPDDPAPPLFAQPLRTEAEGSPQPPASGEGPEAGDAAAPVESAPTAYAADTGQGAPDAIPETIAPPAVAADPVIMDTPVAASDPVAVDPVVIPPAAPADSDEADAVEAVVVADAQTEAVVVADAPPEAVVVFDATAQTVVEPLAAVEPPPFIAVEEPTAEAKLVPDPMLELSLRLADLETAVRGFARRDESGRAAINALHSELGDYKDDFLVRAQSPMLRALVRLLDDIDEMAKSGRPVTSQDLEFLGDQVVEVLESYGAEEVAEQPEVVDGAFQKVLRTEAADDPAQHRRVAAILRRGWRAHGRLLRPQNVSVYVFTEPEAEQAATEPEAEQAAPEPEAQAPPAPEASAEPAQELQSEPAAAETVSTTVDAPVSSAAQAEPTTEPTTEGGDGTNETSPQDV